MTPPDPRIICDNETDLNHSRNTPDLERWCAVTGVWGVVGVGEVVAGPVCFFEGGASLRRCNYSGCRMRWSTYLARGAPPRMSASSFAGSNTVRFLIVRALCVVVRSEAGSPQLSPQTDQARTLEGHTTLMFIEPGARIELATS
jgi:hypothetical protein